MTQNDVINVLSSISIGTVIAWIIVIAMIVTAIGTGFIKLYKAFEKTQKVKKENEDLKNKVNTHEKQLEEVNGKLGYLDNKLDSVLDILKKQEETKVKEMRHEIIKTAENAVARGNMTVREYKSLCELYEEYHDKRHGNYYVTSLMKKLEDNVDVIGELDENGNDI